MNPFICGKYVVGSDSYTTYALVEREAREAAGHSQYFARYFRDASGAWQELGWNRSPRNPVRVEDQELIDRLNRICAQA